MQICVHKVQDTIIRMAVTQIIIQIAHFCSRVKTLLRPIYIGKNLGFCCTVYTARKTHNIQVFCCTEKRMREKNPNLILFFGKWCACATSLYLWPYVVRITSRAAVGWFRRRSRTTWPKTWIIPARLEQAFTLAKKPWKTGGVSKNPTPEVGFSIRVFCSV